MRKKVKSEFEQFIDANIKEHNIIVVTLENKNMIPTKKVCGANLPISPNVFNCAFGSIEGGYVFFNNGASTGCYVRFNPEGVTRHLESFTEKNKKMHELWLNSDICIDLVVIIDNKICLLMNLKENDDKTNYYQEWKKLKSMQQDDMHGYFVFEYTPTLAVDEASEFPVIKRKEINYTVNMVEFIDKLK